LTLRGPRKLTPGEQLLLLLLLQQKGLVISSSQGCSCPEVPQFGGKGSPPEALPAPEALAKMSYRELSRGSWQETSLPGTRPGVEAVSFRALAMGAGVDAEEEVAGVEAFSHRALARALAARGAETEVLSDRALAQGAGAAVLGYRELAKASGEAPSQELSPSQTPSLQLSPEPVFREPARAKLTGTLLTVERAVQGALKGHGAGVPETDLETLCEEDLQVDPWVPGTGASSHLPFMEAPAFSGLGAEASLPQEVRYRSSC